MHDASDTPALAPRREISSSGDWFGFARGRLRLTAALAYWLGRVATSFVTTLPVALVLSRTTERLLQGDEALFEAGGFVLLDLFLHQGATLDAALEASIALGLCAAFVNFALLALLLSALTHSPDTPLERWVPNSLCAVPRLLGVSVLLWLGYALLATVGVLAFWVVASLTSELIDERAQTLWRLGSLAPFTGLAFLLQPWSDLARAHASRGKGVWVSACLAARALWRSPGSILTWATLASLGLVSIATGAALASSMGNESTEPGLRTLWFVACSQLGFAGATFARLVWLSRTSTGRGVTTS